MSEFNEEQAQAEVLEVLGDLRKAVELAISICETGPIMQADGPPCGDIELETGGIVVGGWFCSKIKKYP